MAITFTSKLVDGGVTKLTNALVSSVPINITKWEISNSAGIVLNPALTSVPGIIVDSGTSAEMSFDLVSADQVIIRVILDESMGPYDIGTIGLYSDDNTLIVISTLSELVPKQPNAVGVVGNRYTFSIPITFTNVGDAINFSILGNLFASWPYVQTIADLPDANLAPFEGYIVREDPSQARPITAIRNEYPANSGLFIWTFDYHNSITADDNTESDNYKIEIVSKDHIWTSNSIEKMRLSSTNGDLDIRSGIITLDSSGSNNGILNSPASIRINIDSNNNSSVESFVIGTNQTTIDSINNVILSANENGMRVGINTGSPDAKLTVNLTGTANAGLGTITEVSNFNPESRISLGAPLVNFNDGIFIGTSNNSVAAGIGILRGSAGWDTNLAFYTNNITGQPEVDQIQEKMRLDHNGNLGLGIIPTSGKFHSLVSGLDNVTYIETQISGNPILSLSASGAGGYQLYTNRTDNSFRIKTEGSSDRLTLDSSGRLLLGTTSTTLAEKMHISTGSFGCDAGDINNSHNDLVIENSGGAGLTFLVNNTTGGAGIIVNSETSDLTINDVTNAMLSYMSDKRWDIYTGGYNNIRFNSTYTLPIGLGGTHSTKAIEVGGDHTLATENTLYNASSGNTVAIGVFGSSPGSNRRAGAGFIADFGETPAIQWQNQQVILQNGSAESPSLTFQNEAVSDTGIFSPGDGILAFTSNGTESARLVGGRLQLSGEGSNTLPGIFFDAESNTGIYFSGLLGSIAISDSGTEVAAFRGTSGVRFLQGISVNESGNATQHIKGIYTGVFNSAGTQLLGPSGFSVTKNSDTQYTITHNLASTNYTVILTPNNAGGDDFWIDQRNANTLVIRVTDSSGNTLVGGIGFDYTIIKL